ncbi:MAG: iron-sulfur cluster assembly scaffold protein [Nanoarchaeota archaeon]|nr:iron-sulfur cluster assembly scaffold protein [Nanoarchaeota archaeon]MBU1501237.1 iron-sulfur cluster assembly scaffold protein [Nanoarchaeota archaeon]MBU2458966.1 iron-sulfur cluster assembly scaffold protein [Nanoarchaeota archaeon]
MTKTNHTEIPDDMYREHILELYKSPSNFGTLEKANHKATEHNAICGDEITVQLFVKNEIVKDVKFSGSGCVISMVASSLLTDKIKGMKISEVLSLNKEDILKLMGIKVTPARIKCALLPLEAAQKALK